MKINEIYQGDSLDVLRGFEDNSIDCCITSPPYWALRDYGAEGQLGLEPTFYEYIDKLCLIFEEVRRVLKKEGTCFVNLGDTYGGSGKGAGGGYSDKSTLAGFTSSNTKGRRMAKESWNFKKAPKTEGDISKSLCQIPSRFAIQMTGRDWILRNEIVWHKPNAMPSSAVDRFTVDFEKVFFFVKQRTYYFEQQLEPYTEPINRWGGTMVKRLNGADEYGMKQRIRDYRPIDEGKNKRCVWSINTEPFSEAHFATYPESLIAPMIKAGCPENGIVLDPFMGSGTTAVVAKKLGRNFVGIDLNPDYIEIARKRIAKTPQNLFQKLSPF
jgi:site-specific DNA-methyltransferase (adenine-specific)